MLNVNFMWFICCFIPKDLKSQKTFSGENAGKKWLVLIPHGPP